VFEITGNSAKINQFIDLMRRSAWSRCRAPA
jgi:acetolactate synthase small subunit